MHGEELDQAAVDYTLVWPGEPLQAPDGWAPDSAAEAIWRQQGAVEGGILVNVYCDEYPCIGVLSAESSDMDHTAIATSLGCDFFGYSGGNVYSLCGEGELPADSIDRLQARLMAAVAWQADD